MSGKLTSFLDKAFPALSRRQSAHLGDRKNYVGASDVAGCSRKAALSKIAPPENNRTHAELCVMGLGHAIEDYVADLFVAGGFTAFRREETLRHEDHEWFTCHVDFIVVAETKVRVIELKSSKGIPSQPYSTWVNQLHVQMGMAKSMYPDKEVVGSILAIDRVGGHIKEFGQYSPNESIYNYMTEKALAIWSAVHESGQLPEPEPSLLCSFCPFQDDCPAHKLREADIPEDVLTLAREYKELAKQQREMKKTLDLMADKIKEWTGESFSGEADGVAIKVSRGNSYNKVDTALLRSLYAEIFEEVSQEAAGAVRLTIR